MGLYGSDDLERVAPMVSQSSGFMILELFDSKLSK